jgi:uncharacterized cysteine cluster protein YcgN (CxxCxxCC family)
LISGSADSVQRAGISVRGRVVTETAVNVEDIQHRVIKWLKAPNKPIAKRPRRR